MKITKLGHCCLLIEENGKKILTDPGTYSTAQDSITGIDIVVISHEHGDHYHAESVKKIMANNPNAIVVTNTAVGAKLTEIGVSFTVVEGRDMKEFLGISVEAFDCRHEEVFEQLGQVQNTAYMMAGKLFYPGDAWCDPQKPVDTLALPVAGPWCRMRDAINYAIKLKPNKAFPVHDAMIKSDSSAGIQMMMSKIMAGKGVNFVPMAEGDSKDF